jgi:hypothetical protein
MIEQQRKKAPDEVRKLSVENSCNLTLLFVNRTYHAPIML